jgi:predicted metal-dependent hydrolase
MSKVPDYSITRSKRKTLSIYIERDGAVSVLAPEHITDDKLAAIVEAKSYQIFKFLAEQKLLNQSKVKRELVNAESYSYLGRNYQLRLVRQQEIPLQFNQGKFSLLEKEKKKANEHFIHFYKTKGSKRITERVNYYKTKMGVSVTDVRIIDLQNRWASCTRAGKVNFNWKCMMAPLTIIDYIVVHELAHLKYDNHSERFWNEVDKILPDYLERKAWLKMNGAGLSL